MAKGKPISLSPLKLDDILRIMVTTPSVKKPVMPKRSKSKSSSKASS